MRMRKEKYETCRHAIKAGEFGVYVKAGCPKATLINGKSLMSSKPRCERCDRWEEK